jgi:phosphoribosylformimino-5-aminoimidazole carboxamide ribotide isomerase
MSRFELVPAIDLLNGRCVRLTRGRFDAATVYDDDPVAVASRFVRHPIRRLHVVDLDGARAGEPRNRDAIAGVVAVARELPVQVGGGLRSLASIEETLELGVDRVVLGTAALRDPALVREAAGRFPGRIAVGLDTSEGRVAVEGWFETSEASALEVARRFEDAGVAALIHTDIARDGTLEGPNLEATGRLAEGIDIPVLASGGVGSEEDVRRAADLAERGVAGLIVGRALYTGAVDLERALRIVQCC